MQVFYVNIGGGEPTVRPRLLGAARLRHRARRRRQVLHQRHPDHAGAAPRALAANDYVDVQISLDGATAEVNDAVRGAGLLRHRARGRMEHLAAAGFGELQDLGRRHPRRTSASSTTSRRSPTATAPSCG